MPDPKMAPFWERFPDIAARETRIVTLPRPMEGLPAGGYAFLELYCDGRKCDCRRVILRVHSGDPPGPVLASINYGWESVAFYRKWLRGDREAARDMTGASLDPINRQSHLAPSVLRLFHEVLLPDQNYVERLGRHYAMFKADLAPPRKAKSRPRPGGRRRKRP